MFLYCFCGTSQIIKWKTRSPAKRRSAWNASRYGIGTTGARVSQDREWLGLERTKEGGKSVWYLYSWRTRSSEPLMAVSALWGWQIFVSCFPLGPRPRRSPPWPPLCPSEITEGGLQLIARIIKFNIYLNKYNQPAVWQGTQFIKSPCLFVVSLIKI